MNLKSSNANGKDIANNNNKKQIIRQKSLYTIIPMIKVRAVLVEEVGDNKPGRSRLIVSDQV